MLAESFVKNGGMLMRLIGLETTRHGMQPDTENYWYLIWSHVSGSLGFSWKGVLSRKESKQAERLQKT